MRLGYAMIPKEQATAILAKHAGPTERACLYWMEGAKNLERTNSELRHQLALLREQLREQSERAQGLAQAVAKDKYANAALMAYADQAYQDDKEYAEEIYKLARKARAMESRMPD